MDTILLKKKFERIGARVKFDDSPSRRRSAPVALSLDIGNDRRGEYFEVTYPAAKIPTVQALDVQPRDQHLLLLVREGGEKSKYLCGYDERHWFVAAIPESAPVGTVRQAKDALQPRIVRHAVSRQGLSGRDRNRRKNSAFVRQGEWFFLPMPSLVIEESRVLKNEPLSRGIGSKPHWVDDCFRTGGETVYVCDEHPTGVTEQQYRQILSRSRRARYWGWQIMQLNPGVFVRGRVRHPDHATIRLADWHQVIMNTENESRAMQHVAFLD